MANVLSKGSLFPEELVKGMINQVKGESVLAQLTGATPIPFNGQTEFIFNFDNEISIVAENAKKPAQGASISTRTITPLKVVYIMRTSDEFMIENDAYQLGVLQAFGEGFARKLARGFDLMALHGINPFDDKASTTIGTNCFDKAGVQAVTAAKGASMDATIEAAIALVQDKEYDVTGLAMAPAVRSALAALTYDGGQKLYPQLAWGSNPGSINGMPVQVSANISHKASDATTTDQFLLGDFRNNFRWGFARQMPIEVIQYGDPDNTGVDLKGSNQVAIRGEAYLGWAIFDPNAFALHSISAV